ncbi:MAG: hypothetical protein ACE5IZ_02880 [Dehalococcoidia bacterium]
MVYVKVTAHGRCSLYSELYEGVYSLRGATHTPQAIDEQQKPSEPTLLTIDVVQPVYQLLLAEIGVPPWSCEDVRQMTTTVLRITPNWGVLETIEVECDSDMPRTFDRWWTTSN